MRELTESTVLALHALHLMTRQTQAVTTAEISRLSGFSTERVEEILSKLGHAGMITAIPGEGFVLGRAPAEISIRDLVETIVEPQTPSAPCGGNFEACPSRACCVLAPLCRSAEMGYQEALRSFTLAELMHVPLEFPNCLDPKLRVEVS